MLYFSSMKHLSELTRLVNFFETLGCETLDQVEELFAENVVFVNPMGRLLGREAMWQRLHNLCRKYPQFKFIVSDFHGDKQRGFLRWQMSYEYRGSEHEINGMSYVSFDEEQKVLLQEDFWDASQAIFSEVSSLNLILQRVKGLLRM